MKILIIHNEYKIHGGEDTVVKKIYAILKNKNIDLQLYTVNNSELDRMRIFERLELIFNNIFLRKTREDLIHKVNFYKPDIVHIHNVYPLISPRIYHEMAKRGIKIIQTLHNYRFICPNGLLFRKGNICEACLEKKSLYQCAKYSCYRNSKLQSWWYARMIDLATKRGYFEGIDKFIALNPFGMNKMINNGFDSTKFEIIPNGIPYTPLESCENINTDYYLYIGRLSDEKGIRTIIDSFKSNKRVLKMIGTGPLEKLVKNELKKNDNIEYLGFMSGQEKNQLIANAKAIIVPSEWYENLPTVVIEAYMHRTPAIVSKIGGVQYMVEDGYNGLKFEAGNVDDLNKTIVEFEKLDYHKLQNNALDTFMKKYKDDVVLEKMLKLYRNVLKNHETR